MKCLVPSKLLTAPEGVSLRRIDHVGVLETGNKTTSLNTKANLSTTGLACELSTNCATKSLLSAVSYVGTASLIITELF